MHPIIRKIRSLPILSRKVEDDVPILPKRQLLSTEEFLRQVDLLDRLIGIMIEEASKWQGGNLSKNRPPCLSLPIYKLFIPQSFLTPQPPSSHFHHGSSFCSAARTSLKVHLPYPRSPRCPYGHPTRESCPLWGRKFKLFTSPTTHFWSDEDHWQILMVILAFFVSLFSLRFQHFLTFPIAFIFFVFLCLYIYIYISFKIFNCSIVIVFKCELSIIT